MPETATVTKRTSMRSERCAREKVAVKFHHLLIMAALTALCHVAPAAWACNDAEHHSALRPGRLDEALLLLAKNDPATATGALEIAERHMRIYRSMSSPGCAGRATKRGCKCRIDICKTRKKDGGC